MCAIFGWWVRENSGAECLGLILVKSFSQHRKNDGENVGKPEKLVKAMLKALDFAEGADCSPVKKSED